jgi:DNA-binding transcriptional LysR family regulator
MELRHLRYFIALADELHFGRAAERVGIEQSPFSRAIRELENDLGVRLFARTSRRTQITRAGETFLVEARRILNAVNSARALTRTVATNVKGRLRIGVSESISQSRVARLLARCCAEQPNVEFEVVERTQQRQAEQLREGSLDIGLAPLPLWTDGLRSEPLWTAALAVLLPGSHPLLGVERISIATLFREPKVACHPELRYTLDNDWESVGSGARRRPEYVAVTSLPMLLEMVGAGIVVGVILAAQADALRRLDVLARPLADPSPQITTFAISRFEEPSENINLFLQRARGFS